MVDTWNGENFEKKLGESDVLTVVKFFTEQCPSCRTMGIVFDSIAKDWERDEPEVRFAQVNIEREDRLIRQLRIRSVPTVLIFRGGKPVVESVGSLGRGRLQELIRSAM